MILKALNKNGEGDYKWIVNAMNYAINKKVDIISMSLGGYIDDENLRNAVKKAVNNNILVVCAAGNEGDNNALTDEYSYPASYSEVISVGAVDEKAKPAYFSNSNNLLDIMAPGVGILSTFKNNSYAILDGTSMAAPHVSGALALIKNYSNNEFNRNLSESEIYAQLIKFTLDLNYDKHIQGNGLVFLESPKVPRIKFK
ncbi:major intracellular serine protease [[Clostridium] sordellii ATCC 9714]|nr:major intracellular serine protease [[Clostridium] sordellii ATCC 9714] [Paeniclostridium sordellii ATCC 9714]